MLQKSLYMKTTWKVVNVSRMVKRGFVSPQFLGWFLISLNLHIILQQWCSEFGFGHVTHLSIYEARCLFCFDLICRAEISQTMVFYVMFLVSLESFPWERVYWLGLRLFVAMVWKLCYCWKPQLWWKVVYWARHMKK